MACSQKVTKFATDGQDGPWPWTTMFSDGVAGGPYNAEEHPSFGQSMMVSCRSGTCSQEEAGILLAVALLLEIPDVWQRPGAPGR